MNLTGNNITTRDESVRNDTTLMSLLDEQFCRPARIEGRYIWQTSNDVLGGNAGTGTVTLFYGQNYAARGRRQPPCSRNSELH